MASLSVHSSARARSGRPRRRRLFLAEVLETRRLLSVSAPALPHAVVSAPLVPALVGPMTSSTGTTSSAAGALSPSGSGQATPQVLVPVYAINFNFGNLNETLVIFEFAGSTGTSSPAPTGSSTAAQGPIATFSGTTADTTTNTTTASSSPTAQTPDITPLTATILSSPAASGRAVVVIIAPQPLVANLGPSTIPATAQAILATAALEEQPIGPPVLGQGFESPVGQGFESLFGPVLPARPVQGWIDLELPGADFVEPIDAAPVMPEPAAPMPDQPAVPVPTDANAVTEILLDPVALSDWGKMPASPILTSELDAARHDEYPTWSLAAIVGTTAIATGGYQLVLGGSARFNQRWLPSRRSAPRRKAAR